MKKFAVVIAGCGHRDGTEITEAVSTLIALSETGSQYKVFAPEMSFNVVNPLVGHHEPTGETRNTLVESARIARGDVEPMEALKAAEFDGLVFPGGFGAALHLCTWAQNGAKCEVHPEVERVIREFYANQKPIAAICIAPALMARVLGSEGITITLGKKDKVTSSEIAKTGAILEECNVDDFVSDREHRIITTPAYMFGEARPFEVFTGIRKAIRELVEMS